MNICEKRIGEYIPPTMAEKETRKDKLHQNYLKRKEYEERTRAEKKAQFESPKEQIRAEDREKSIYFHAEVPNIPGRANKRRYKYFIQKRL